MRVINFNAGPAALPLAVLEKTRAELLDFQGSGMSIMEHSHRGPEYTEVHNDAIARLTRLLAIPPSHQVLFLTGGASTQFALVPMNFRRPQESADYVVTGVWAEKAYEEAMVIGKTRLAASTRNQAGRYLRVPRRDEIDLDPNAAFIHTTSNNTVVGTQFHSRLDFGNVPHVCDMSSDFLWKKIDVADYDFIYAGAQKNLGPSGVVVAVARKEFMERGRSDIPTIFRYAVHSNNNSTYNTPPTFAIYLVRNVLEWVESLGGLDAIESRNRAKAQRLYDAVDRLHGFYRAPVEIASRSVMNIVFACPSEALDDTFVREAKKAGMVGLRGYRTTGGIRVSAYNAVSVEDVDTLVSFMDSFAKRHG